MADKSRSRRGRAVRAGAAETTSRTPFSERGVAEARAILGNERDAERLAFFIRGVNQETAFTSTADETLRRVRERESGRAGFNEQTVQSLIGRRLTDAELLQVIRGVQR